MITATIPTATGYSSPSATASAAATGIEITEALSPAVYGSAATATPTTLYPS